MAIAILALASAVAFAQAPEALPPPSALEKRLAGPRIVLKSVEVEGTTILDRAAIDEATRAWIGKDVDGAQLRGLADALTARYEALGYVGSRVELPDQEIRDGIVRFKAIEARLASVTFSKPTFWNREFALRDWVTPRDDAILHLPTLQERLALLRESGLVERLDAEVVPFDARSGTYGLVLGVEESFPIRIALRYANDRSPSIGATRAELAFQDRSLFGLGDALDARIGRTDGLDDSSVNYRLPISRTPVALIAARVRSDSLAIDPPAFRDLDITAVADTDTFGADWTIAKTMPLTAIARYTHDRRESRTLLLGLPFSFIPGIPDGTVTARVDRLAIEALLRRENWSASARLQASRGRTNAEEEFGDDAVAKDFSVASLSLLVARDLGGEWGQLRARLDAQYARDRLVPFERLAIGGSTTVRGYRENLLLRDTGAIASIEWRSPDYVVRRDAFTWGTGAFVDAGWGRNARGAALDGPATIASAGITLRADIYKYVSASVALALPTKRHLTNRADAQDRGVHYAIAFSWP